MRLRIPPIGLTFALLPALLLPLVGCKKASEESSVSPTSVAPGSIKPDPKSVQDVQSNPDIPPQAKAAIVAHMQGKGDTAQPAPPK